MNNNTVQQEKYFRMADLTRILNVAQSTLYQMQREGRFIKPTLQPSRRLSLYSAADLEAWIAAQAAAGR